jgi:hypothetical protein
LKCMEEHGGLPYYIDVKKRCHDTLPVILDLTLDDLAARAEPLTAGTAKIEPLLTAFEKEKAGPTLKASKGVCAILKNWNDHFDILDEIKEYYYPLMVWGTDDPASESPQIAIVWKACEKNPEEKKLIPIPNKQGYASINAIKMKYEDPKNKNSEDPVLKRADQITEDAINLLGLFDTGPLFETACKKLLADTDPLTTDVEIQ